MAGIATRLFASLILVVCAATAVAAPDRARMDEPFEITADEIKFDGQRSLYVADRRVHVVQGNRSLRARWVAFSTETRLGVAEGNVELIEGESSLHAEFMIFNVDTLQGTLYQSELDISDGGFYIEAMELVRTGHNQFAARDAIFTTCRCEEGERLPWVLAASRAHFELGDYGTLTNSTFDVLGVPVLWIPWIFFPIKSERETGFLLPDFQFGGRGGIGVGLPFFWAALPELNVILTPRYYSRKGYKQDVQLEYVLGERSWGNLFVAGIRDMEGGTNEAVPKDRWAVIWAFDQDLPVEWRWQTDLKLASDNLYADDFDELRAYDSFRFIESTTNVARDFGVSGAFGAMVGARYADDVQGSHKDDADEYLIQRFAEVRGDVQPGAATAPFGVDTRFDSELIYFSGLQSVSSSLTGLNPNVPTSRALRTDGRFYDLGYNGRFDQADYDAAAAGNLAAANGENNGVFDPGEPLSDRGARVILHPRLSRMVPLGSYVELVPEIGWQQTLYSTSSQEFAERGLATARTALQTRLIRDYTDDVGGVTRHLVEPRLEWAFVSERSQRQNPLFVPRGQQLQTRLRTLSLESVTRDPSDRIESTNQIVVAVDQSWFSARNAGTAPRLEGDVALAYDYDFSNPAGAGLLVGEGHVYPIGPISGRFRGVFDLAAGAFNEGGAELAVHLYNDNPYIQRLNFLAGYSYLRNPPKFFETDPSNSSSFLGAGDSELNQIDFQVQVEVWRRIRLTYGAIYEIAQEARGFIRNRGMVEYVSKCKCWGAGVRLDYENRNGFQGGLMIRFIGLGDEGGSIFDGGLGTGLNL